MAALALRSCNAHEYHPRTSKRSSHIYSPTTVVMHKPKHDSPPLAPGEEPRLLPGFNELTHFERVRGEPTPPPTPSGSRAYTSHSDNSPVQHTPSSTSNSWMGAVLSPTTSESYARSPASATDRHEYRQPANSGYRQAVDEHTAWSSSQISMYSPVSIRSSEPSAVHEYPPPHREQQYHTRYSTQQVSPRYQAVPPPSASRTVPAPHPYYEAHPAPASTHEPPPPRRGRPRSSRSDRDNHDPYFSSHSYLEVRQQEHAHAPHVPQHSPYQWGPYPPPAASSYSQAPSYHHPHDPYYAHSQHTHGQLQVMSAFQVPYDGDRPRDRSRRRGNLPRQATDKLKAWLAENKDQPYPTEEEKLRFSVELGLTPSQISNWFINGRRRLVPRYRNETPREPRNEGQHH